MSCVLCRIVAGDLPCTLLDEGDRCLVILDRNQAARGHMLVIPKMHVTMWHELDAKIATEMAGKAHVWACALVEALRPDGYNLLVNNGVAAGQDIFHVHVHITPRSAGDGYYGFGGSHRVLSDAEAVALGAELLRHATKR